MQGGLLRMDANIYCSCSQMYEPKNVQGGLYGGRFWTGGTRMDLLLTSVRVTQWTDP